MTETNAEMRITSLERQLRQQKRLFAGLTLIAGVFALAAFTQPSTNVIRTRGIVIVDDKGRERILIGAPIPAARNRVRTDLARAESAWAKRFPDPKAYMRWYADYRHTMHGMLVLDENGFDRLAIGDSTPDPNIGKRIGAGPGIDINDAQGFERSGYGLLTVAGKDRVVLGLDGNDGNEAVTLSVHDGGGSGLRVDASNNRSIFLGMASPQRVTGRPDTVSGLVLKQGAREVHRLAIPDSAR